MLLDKLNNGDSQVQVKDNNVSILYTIIQKFVACAKSFKGSSRQMFTRHTFNVQKQGERGSHQDFRVLLNVVATICIRMVDISHQLVATAGKFH